MTRITAAWQHASKRRRHFVKNIAIGLAISVLLSFLETNVAIGRVRDALLTWQIAQFNSSGVGADVLWLDIDESTYLRWGAPPVTPRDRICRLIDFALRGNARSVVVDVDLTFPSPPGVFPKLQSCRGGTRAAPAKPTSADSELAEYLRQRAETCRARTGAARCAPIVLTRALRSSYRFAYDDGVPARVPRAAFFEDRGFVSGGAVVWTSPNFDYDEDSLIRRWRLWEPVCEPAAALASTELVAAASFAGKSADDVARALGAMQPRCVPLPGRGQRHAAASEARAELDIGYPLELTTAAQDRRFFYRIAWNAKGGRPLMAAFLPAALVTEADALHPFDPAIVANRIVVIGGSYRDNPDFHRTPLGTMPGTLVLINAIQALITDDRIHEVPLWLRFLIEAVLIIAVSAMFLFVGAARAMMASTVLVIACAVTIGYDFLNRGYWIDPVLPLISIQIHELIALLEHRAQRARTS